MDIDNFLKENTNKYGQIKNKDLQPIIAKLKKIIAKKTKNKKISRNDLKTILHESLTEIGWSEEQILSLNKTTKLSKQIMNNVSPGFFNYKPSGNRGIVAKPSNNKFFQGGSPGLGKGKS